MGFKTLQSKIKSLSNIYLSGLASIVCVKTRKKHAVWFQYFYPKIPEVKFLRNFRNLTTDDTARLCPISTMHWRKIFASCDAFGLLHAILRAKARNSDFSASYFAALSAAQR